MRHRGSVGHETFCFQWRIDKFLLQAGSKKWAFASIFNLKAIKG